MVVKGGFPFGGAIFSGSRKALALREAKAKCKLFLQYSDYKSLYKWLPRRAFPSGGAIFSGGRKDGGEKTISPFPNDQSVTS